jgi:hypothetical protein
MIAANVIVCINRSRTKARGERMNEGKGLMLKVALSYKNGSITKKLLKEICRNNKWDYKFDAENGVLIFPKLWGGKR